MRTRTGKIVYGIVSTAVLALSFWYLYQMFERSRAAFQLSNISAGLFCAFIAVVVLLHLIKMGRLFLIMLEQKIRPAMFAMLYSETAFVNFMIPFKLGEAFRFYALSYATNNWKIGLLSMVIDRFFDTAALLVFLIPMELIFSGGPSAISMVLLAFVLIVVVIYAAFPSLYNYMNRFLMLNTQSKRSTKALGALEELNGWYSYAQSLLRGRLAIIIVFSVVAWAVEYAALYLLAKSLGEAFVPQEFVTYIHSIFFSGTLDLTYAYTAASGGVLAAGALVFFIVARVKKEKWNNA